MQDQEKREALEASTFFDDGKSARDPVPHTIAKGTRPTDLHLHKGMVNGQPAESFPFTMTEQDLTRGAERYEIHCATCHGAHGDGNGEVVLRGYTRPVSFAKVQYHQTPAGKLYRFVTFAKDPTHSFAPRTTTEDRWRIVAYVQHLSQLEAEKMASTNGPPATLPVERREMVNR
jgi:cytochrome c